MKNNNLLLLIIMLMGNICNAQDLEINGPGGSGNFGSVTVLPNGNFVVVDPLYDEGATTDVGAVYLYDGSSKLLISTLKGTAAGDNIGVGGVYVLTNGNYVVRSQNWDNGAVSNAGAVTFGNAATGISGTVSAANSLIGSSANDGAGFITALSNGNYVVSNSFWDNGVLGDLGAVTWGNGTTGISGVISAANSLVGTKANDGIANYGITALTNGNYVVKSPNWDNGATVDVGAVTWCNGTTGRTGSVSGANSLIGSTTSDNIGIYEVAALTNGNYVVCSHDWDNGGVIDAGAVTWGNGATGISGTVSNANSLVGSVDGDFLGSTSISVLTNGNYVITSSFWDNGVIAEAGAVTWANGAAGISGIISIANSLVGTTDFDMLGSEGVKVLTNGNYVVASANWDNGVVMDAGAVTWGNGTTGRTGTISGANSLIGSMDDDRVGETVVTLTNGNYVCLSSSWDDGAVADAGAASWGNGTTGISGSVSSANSFIGSTTGDMYSTGALALTNGNYVLRSPNWDDGPTANVGAVTWANGTTGITGSISSANSLIGSTTNDNVGLPGVVALTNGNYVVRSRLWDDGPTSNVGAVTWGSGTAGTTGTVSATNSLIGSTSGDNVGNTSVSALSNGNYVVVTNSWDDGATPNVGAVSWGNGASGTSGMISITNSFIGSTANDNIGNGGVTTLANGNYFFLNSTWDDGAVADARALTLGNGNGGSAGIVSSCNSVLGEVANGITLGLSNPTYNYVIVQKNPTNKLTISNRFAIPFPVITSQPSDALGICNFYNTTFSVTATLATGYQWEVSTNGGISWNTVFNGGIYSGATTATLSLTNVTAADHNNKYRCLVTGACSPDAISDEVLLTVKAWVNIPGTLSATNVSLTQATVSWASVNGDNMRIALRKVGTASWHIKDAAYADSYIYTGSFSGDANYEWKVKVQDDGCWGEWSSVATFYVCKVPLAPTALSSTNVYTNKATLSWSHGGGDEVRIALRRIGTSWNYQNMSYTASYTWNGSFSKNATYEWMVRVRCGASWGPWSSASTFTTGTVAGMIISDNDPGILAEDMFVEAYPNPNNGEFTIQSSHEATFKLINELGQLIQTIAFTQENNFRVEMNHDSSLLNPGIYFLTGTINGNVITKKLIIQ